MSMENLHFYRTIELTMFWCVYGAGLLDCQRWSRPRWRQNMTANTIVGRASAADDRSVTAQSNRYTQLPAQKTKLNKP